MSNKVECPDCGSRDFEKKQQADGTIYYTCYQCGNDFIYPDSVNHPQHYQGNVEVIDYLRDKLTAEEFIGFCKANVIKYISRARLKNGNEDLRKAKWYLDKLNEVINSD